MKRYRGYIADNIRWRDFALREDDVIITTPSKCGTTWMQTIVGMLLLERVDLGQHMGMLSPWLDMLTRSADDVYALLEAQQHRRFIKTHTPLDGLPESDTVTYLTVLRHPLDAALSNKDHNANMAAERVAELVKQTSAERDELRRPPAPDDPREYLLWWIGDDHPPTGTGLTNLAEFAHQARTYWEARNRPNVHLFHYAGMQADLDGEMRRVAAALGVAVDANSWEDYVKAATLDSMRDRASDLVPEAFHNDMWDSVEGFFKAGGRRNWGSLLTDDELAHFEDRLASLAGADAASWAIGGKVAQR